MPALQEFHFNLNRLALAFAALGEPGGETFRETFGGQAEAGFEAAVGEGQGVVEIGGVGEVAHGKLIEPFERAGASLATDEDINLKLLGVHKRMIAPEGPRAWLTGCEPVSGYATNRSLAFQRPFEHFKQVKLLPSSHPR
jgi:hypothetical protein